MREAIEVKNIEKTKRDTTPRHEKSIGDDRGSVRRRALCAACAKEQEKGTRWMPRLPEAMKDAVSGETPRGSANGTRSGGVRMGQPARRDGAHAAMRANAGNRNIPVPAGGERKIDSPSSGERTGRSPNRGGRGRSGVVGRRTWGA